MRYMDKSFHFFILCSAVSHFNNLAVVVQHSRVPVSQTSYQHRPDILIKRLRSLLTADYCRCNKKNRLRWLCHLEKIAKEGSSRRARGKAKLHAFIGRRQTEGEILVSWVIHGLWYLVVN